jgi:hypothetical protein
MAAFELLGPTADMAKLCTAQIVLSIVIAIVSLMPAWQLQASRFR